MSSETLEILSSRKGRALLKLNGYLFQFSKNGVNKFIWRCDQWRKFKCPSRLHTDESTQSPSLLCQLGSHNHEPNAIACEIKKVMTAIRNDAKSSSQVPAKIIADNLRGVSAAAQRSMPLIQNIKRGIRNIREFLICLH